MAANQQTILIAEEYRRNLTLVVDGAVSPIQQRYIDIIDRYSDQLRVALQREAKALAQGQTLALSTMVENERVRAILAGARTQLDATGLAAQTALYNAATGEAMPLAFDYNRTAIASQLRPGFGEMGASIPPSMVEAVVERAEGMTAYLSDVSASTMAKVQRALEDGVLLGENPRIAAQRLSADVRAALTTARHSAERIMRTEMLDVTRNADLTARLANRDVLQRWEWLSAADERTCASCWALHGEFFNIDVPGPDDHPNGRCVSVPVVRDDLALDNLPYPVPRDVLWNRLTKAQQLRVLGPTRYELLQTGAKWSDFVAQKPSTALWRAYKTAAPIKDIPGGPQMSAALKHLKQTQAAATKKAIAAATKKATATAPKPKAPPKKKTAPARRTTTPKPQQPVQPQVDPSGLADFGTKVALPDGRMAVNPAAVGLEAGKREAAASRWTINKGNKKLAAQAKKDLADAGFTQPTAGKHATIELGSMRSTMDITSPAHATAHWVRIGNDNIQSLIRTGQLPEQARDAAARAAAGSPARQAMLEARLEGRARQAMRHLDDGIAASTDHGGFVGYRGVNGESLRKSLGDDWLNAVMRGDRRLVGTEFTDTAYTAVSVEPTVARGFSGQGAAPATESVIFEVRVPPTKPALSVNGQLSRSGSTFAFEEEMILGRNTRFRVVEVIGSQEQVYKDAMKAATGMVSQDLRNRSIVVLEVIG